MSVWLSTGFCVLPTLILTAIFLASIPAVASAQAGQIEAELPTEKSDDPD
ncbi:MAG: hypothetical protein MOB07_12595 [Acidobacteria bacterium]|nr:hypothetical protein [Acidobacteriota bacterium]